MKVSPYKIGPNWPIKQVKTTVTCSPLVSAFLHKLHRRWEAERGHHAALLCQQDTPRASLHNEYINVAMILLVSISCTVAVRMNAITLLPSLATKIFLEPPQSPWSHNLPTAFPRPKILLDWPQSTCNPLHPWRQTSLRGHKQNGLHQATQIQGQVQGYPEGY